MIGALAAGVGSIALLPLGGCTPAAYASWYIDTDKDSVEADEQSVQRLLTALGYTDYGRAENGRQLDFGTKETPFRIEVRTNRRATKINVTFVEIIVTRFSPLANERIAAIDVALVQEFGPDRVERT
jgi:hypothetical protein